MRIKTMMIGALLLASAGLVQAQSEQQTTAKQAPTAATPAASFTPKWGSFDFGYRGDSVTGDEARYNRFRDLRDGAYVQRFQVLRENADNVFRAEAFNVGYRDQRYFGAFEKIGKVKTSFEWNQVPLYMTTLQSSLYQNQGGGVLGINDSVQTALQAAAAVNPATRDRAIENALAGADELEIRSRRDVALFDFVYAMNRDVDLKFELRNSHRTGNQVMAMGFGTSPGLLPAVEFGAPLDDRTTDVRGALEYATGKALLNVGYDASWYDTQVPFVRFDNPLRATDISGGPSVGQFAWWPSNSAFNVNLNGSYRMAKRTSVSAAFSVGRWEQDQELPPPTVNTALVSPPLERASAETRADITSTVLRFNSRPVQPLHLNASYRYYDYDNKTPHFRVQNAIIGDWSAGTQIHETEPASFKRHTFDLDASYSVFKYLTFGAGYSRENADRTFRIFESTADDTYRVTADSVASQYLTVRLKYEYATRTGDGFDQHLLDEVGEQPGMRHYDIADRDRSRTTAIFTVTPVGFLSINASVGMGEDEYKDTGFGLRDSENRNWSIGFDAAPNETVNFGVSYGFDKYSAYQYSRTANPAPDPTFTDPRRDWSTDTDDKVKTTTVYLDLTKALPKTDINMSYDYSDGEATYLYTMANQALVLPTLTQLPQLENTLSGGRFDLKHFIRPNVALGLLYHYEKYEVDDFGLDTYTINRLDPKSAANGLLANTIYAGYLFRPYTGHTWGLRMIYLW